MQRIINGGHEVAAHGCDHWNPKADDVINSKRILEELTGQTIKGYRQPRMFKVDIAEQARQGYLYNASLNPAFIPGRYMHLTTPRTYFWEKGVLQIPASVSPILRIPMFWLSLHNFPLWSYKALTFRILKHDGYFNTYFHPWEFYPLGEHPELKMPYIIRHNAGQAMYDRLKDVILSLKAKGEEFGTYKEFAERITR
jgi:peptidoglycan/xylan/chitin deacetylase (PgdA/CDA1 family)